MTENLNYNLAILENYQDCKCAFEKVEGEDIYECGKCGGLGGYCWRCGMNVKRRKNKCFCVDCENYLNRELEFKKIREKRHE